MSDIRPQSFFAKLDRVVTTGLEPGGGATIVIDLGDMPERVERLKRYMCVQVPRSELRALGEALIKASEHTAAPRGSA